MKKLRLFFLMGMVLLFSSQFLFAQSKQEKKEQKEKEIKELLDRGHFTIDVDRALPMGGKALNLTSPYSLEIEGDSVMSYLPYFGRAYNIPYGGGEGLRFQGMISEYNLTYDKKGTAKIQFRTRTDEDNYTFNVQVYKNGSSTIQVTPVNRQAITFHGELAPEKSKEKN